MMKKVLTILLTVFSLLMTNAQDGGDFYKKGRFLVEVGYNIIGGGLASIGGTGITVFTGGGGTAVAIGADLGYFVSEDFAIKFKLGVLSDGGSLTNLSAGGKYYIGGVAPISFDLGMITGGGATAFLGGVSIGYAAKLAPNIYLEPSGGILFGDISSVVGTGELSFALMF